jgi:hypothetical protein
MKSWIPLTLALALGSAAHAQTTCTHPTAADKPPDGNTSTREQMIAGRTDMNRYNTEMQSFLDCIKVKIDAIPAPADPKKLTDDEKQQQKEKDKLSKQYDAAFDELQAAATRFNEQLKIFKAKQKP